MRSLNADVPNTPQNQCPSCGKVNRAGELVCRFCSAALTTNIGSATRTLQQAEEELLPQRGKIGAAIGRPQALAFIVEGFQAVLPVGQRIVIGRFDPQSNGAPPDVDLSEFKAEELGVSRHHLELTWRNGLIYVSDMGSTNGTLLNGQRLVAGMERILRDNDELVIGHLRALVRFISGT
jgi:hypothetical protein